MTKRVDIAPGTQFGRLTVIGTPFKKAGQKHAWYPTECECGNDRHVRKDALLSGKTTSCGCHLRTFRRTFPDHNIEEHPLYITWRNMRRRCEDPADKSYRWYGARGINVCDRWHSFKNFVEDMGAPPSPEHTVDRINPDGHYEPSNCRWATMKEQRVTQRPAGTVTPSRPRQEKEKPKPRRRKDGLTTYWVSWCSTYHSDTGCTRPPYPVWVTGETADDPPIKTICSLFDATDEAAVWRAVEQHFPDWEERFISKKQYGYQLGARFPGFKEAWKV
jgi:hypothetical protein